MKPSDSLDPHELTTVRLRSLWLLDKTGERMSSIQIARQLTEKYEISTTYQAVQNALSKKDGSVHYANGGYKLMEKGRRSLSKPQNKENKKTEKKAEELSQFASIHPDVVKKCDSLFSKGEYAEAVEKSFKVVRDRLRTLTTYETGSEAFGKGKLHIAGAAAANVDSDFNRGVQFLMMAIDMFRNEKSHTSEAKIDDPVRAYQYLVVASLALRFLDNADRP